MSEPGGGPRRLTLVADQIGSVYEIRLGGELDVAGSERLDRALEQASASDAKRIRLDLEDLVFIDSAGLQAILRAKRRGDQDGGRLRMTRGTGEVRKLFELTAMDLVLPYE